VRRTSLSRRVLSGVAGLMLGLGAVLSATAPAQGQLAPGENAVTFISVCEGTYVVLLTPPDSLDPSWSIEAGSGSFWPPADPLPGPGGAPMIFVPKDAGTIEVDFEGSGSGWPETHTWQEPTGCADLPAPGHTAPTCEGPGQIAIPGLPAESVGEFGTETMAYRLNGEPVEPGSTHGADPGSHVVKLVVGDDAVEVVVRAWAIDFDPPSCPNGALAETGARLVLMGGGALVLLTLGGGLYLMARRQISFVP
jgi:hypothetical protein